jgi:WD repeat-containing protein 22
MQSDNSQERSLKIICANHNNGCLHPCFSHPHNNGQNFGDLEVVGFTSLGHSDTDHDTSSPSGTLLYKDYCDSEMVCEASTAGMKEGHTSSSPIDSSRAVYSHSSLKSHQFELEDKDSENFFSEKKLKT